MGKACPVCNCYMLDHQELKGWKRCQSCRWSESEEGKNLLFPDGYKELATWQIKAKILLKKLK